MAFNKKTWKNLIGIGMNMFSMGNPLTASEFNNVPDKVTQEGDYLSAENLNDLEDRIEDCIDVLDASVSSEAVDRANMDTAIKSVLSASVGFIRVKDFTATGTGSSYIQADCTLSGYTPIGIAGWRVISDTTLFAFKGCRIYTLSGTPYARGYRYNPNNESWSIQIYVIYVKDDLI